MNTRSIVCTNANKLVRGNKYGRTEEYYQCEDYSSCPHKEKCCKCKGNRIVRLNEDLLSPSFFWRLQSFYWGMVFLQPLLLTVNYEKI